MNLWSMPTAVYRFYAYGERLLYVGMTNSPEHRFEQHAADKPLYNRQRILEQEYQPRRHERRGDMKSIAQSLVDLGLAK